MKKLAGEEFNVSMNKIIFKIEKESEVLDLQSEDLKKIAKELDDFKEECLKNFQVTAQKERKNIKKKIQQSVFIEHLTDKQHNELFDILNEVD